MAKSLDDQIEIIRQCCDSLGLGDKENLVEADRVALIKALEKLGHAELSADIAKLKDADELEDFLVNTVYG